MDGPAPDPTGPGRFCTDQPVSRARAAALLVRAFSLAPARAAGFTDSAESCAADQIDALYATGITRGCGTDPLRFCPAKAAARAHMAAFLNRARNRPDADPQPTTPG